MHTADNYGLPFFVERSSETRYLSDANGNLTGWHQRLLTHGALLFRGFAVGGIKGFGTFCAEFAQLELMDYSGGASPRKRLCKEPVYTSTEYSSELRIPPHNELSYSSIFPTYLFFWCDIPALTGGETMLADSRLVLNDMPSEIVDEFERKKIRYVRNLVSDASSVYSWQHAFGTSSKSEVEAQCRVIGAAFYWMGTDGLRIEQTGPATLVHPDTREKSWFNQADGFYSDDQFPNNALPRLESRFGDGSFIPRDAIAQIRSVMDKRSVHHCWQRDDVLAIDNILAAHGRAPFSGERRIAVAMA